MGWLKPYDVPCSACGAKRGNHCRSLLKKAIKPPHMRRWNLSLGTNRHYVCGSADSPVRGEGAKRRGKGKAQIQNLSPGTAKGEP